MFQLSDFYCKPSTLDPKSLKGTLKDFSGFYYKVDFRIRGCLTRDLRAGILGVGLWV